MQTCLEFSFSGVPISILKWTLGKTVKRGTRNAGRRSRATVNYQFADKHLEHFHMPRTFAVLLRGKNGLGFHLRRNMSTKYSLHYQILS